MNTPVSKLFQLYISRSDLAETSVAIKGRAMRLFVQWFGDMPAGGATPETAQDYKLLLVKDGSRNRTSANIYLANIQPFFCWLVSHRYIDRNPFNEVRRFIPERRCRPIFSPDEIRRILTVADVQWQIIVRLSAECSLRRGEILNICRDDVSDEWLHVRSKRQTASQWPWPIKNHAEALVLLSGGLQDAIARLLIERPLAQPYIIVEPKLYQRMIKLQNEDRLNYELRYTPYNNFNRAWKRLLKKATIQPRRFQDLRGTFATALRRGGMGIDEVSKVMRHKSIETTRQFYLRYESQELAVKSQDVLKNFYGSYVP